MSPVKEGPVVGVGLANKDFVASVECWERDHKCEATRYFEQVGGPVPVAMVAFSRLGDPPAGCHFIGMVGDDRDGDDIARLLESDGVEAQLLSRAPDTMTARSLVILETCNGTRTLATFAKQIPPLSFTPEQKKLLESACLLHLDGRDLPASTRAAEIVKANGGLVSIDFGTYRPGREKLLSLCDIILCAHNAAEGLYPSLPDPLSRVQALQEYQPIVAGITLAADGVAISEQGAPPTHLRPFKVAEVLDTCGAGDTFHGAFLWAYLSGFDAVKAADFAQATVALRIQKLGNEVGLPNRCDVDAYIAGNPARSLAS